MGGGGGQPGGNRLAQTGGQPNGQRNPQQGGNPATPGPARTLGGGASNGGPPTGYGQRLSPQESQQLNRELRERIADAEGIRDAVAKQGIATTDLDKALDALRQMADDRYVVNPATAADLRAQTVEGLKTFEFDLRRAMGQTSDERLLLGRSGEVSDSYRQAVEQYYRSLAAGQKQ